MTVHLANVGENWRAAAERERSLRLARDVAIRRAHADGMGVREIARTVGIDPTQVTRVLRRSV